MSEKCKMLTCLPIQKYNASGIICIETSIEVLNNRMENNPPTGESARIQSEHHRVSRFGQSGCVEEPDRKGKILTAPTTSGCSGAVGGSLNLLRVQRFCINDGPGIRTTVFLKGCPLQCRWCHNPEAITVKPVLLFNAGLCKGCQLCAAHCPEGVHTFAGGAHKVQFDRCTTCGECLKFCMAEALSIQGRLAAVDEILKEIIKDRDYYEASGGGVTISGGEPLQQPDAVIALARACRAESISVFLDTCGFASRRTFLAVMDVVDGFLFDVKMIDPRAHRAYTGVDNSPILANFHLAVASGKPVRMRVIIIPGLTDTEANLTGLITLARDCRFSGAIDLMPYHRMGAGKYRNMGRDYRMEGVEPPSRAQLEAARSRFQREGFLSTIQ